MTTYAITCTAIRLREFCESLLSEKENNGSQDSSFPELQGIIQATVKVKFRSRALIPVRIFKEKYCTAG